MLRLPALTALAMVAWIATATAGAEFFVVQHSITKECLVVDRRPSSPEWSLLVGTTVYPTPDDALDVILADPTCAPK